MSYEAKTELPPAKWRRVHPFRPALGTVNASALLYWMDFYEITAHIARGPYRPFLIARDEDTARKFCAAMDCGGWDRIDIFNEIISKKGKKE